MGRPKSTKKKNAKARAGTRASRQLRPRLAKVPICQNVGKQLQAEPVRKKKGRNPPYTRVPDPPTSYFVDYLHAVRFQNGNHPEVRLTWSGTAKVHPYFVSWNKYKGLDKEGDIYKELETKSAMMDFKKLHEEHLIQWNQWNSDKGKVWCLESAGFKKYLNYLLC